MPALNQVKNPLSLLNIHLGHMVIEGVDTRVGRFFIKEMMFFCASDYRLGMVE